MGQNSPWDQPWGGPRRGPRGGSWGSGPPPWVKGLISLAPSDPNYSSTAASDVPAGFECLGTDGSAAIDGSNASAGWRFGSTQYATVGSRSHSGSCGPLST